MSVGFQKKLLKAETLAATVQSLKEQGKRIVTTNGCFDILHLGHVRYLQEAKKLGDVLILGLNSDASVKKLKGEGRPINNELARAEVLAALECIDYVVVFGEDTPEKLLSVIRPKIHVKGGDYTIQDLPEAKVVEAGGGEVRVVSLVPGQSTTRLIKTIRG